MNERARLFRAVEDETINLSRAADYDNALGFGLQTENHFDGRARIDLLCKTSDKAAELIGCNFLFRQTDDDDRHLREQLRQQLCRDPQATDVNKNKDIGRVVQHIFRADTSEKSADNFRLRTERYRDTRSKHRAAPLRV